MYACEKCNGITKIRDTQSRWKGGGTRRIWVCTNCRNRAGEPTRLETVEVTRRAFEKKVRDEARRLLADILPAGYFPHR